MMRTGKGMAWRGALCAGLMIALGACGGPPSHDHHSGGDDEGYSEGPRDNGKHDDDTESDNRRPSHEWGKPSGDLRTPGGSDELTWNGGEHGTDDGSDGSTSGPTDSTGEESVCKEKVIVPIALEGEVAPGTCDSRFDPTTLESVYGFHDPQTNEHGDVAFRGSYTGILSITGATADSVQPMHPQDGVCEPYGAGIFAWDNDEERLRPIAISGQQTEVGTFPPIEFSFSAPALNDADQIAFAVRELSGGSAYSAVFLGNVEHRGLEVVVKQGDDAPRGGVFDKFYDVSLNRNGDVAFIASFVNDLVTGAPTNGGAQDLAPTDLPPEPPEGYTGVYLATDGCHGDIKAIARFGDYLEGTNGGRLCGVAGPWLNDQRDVLFQATCIFGGDQFRQGSLFIHRHDDPDHDVDPFLLIGDTVGGGSIGTINVGRPGMNEEEVALRMTVIGPPPAGYHQVIATKRVGEGEGDDCEPRICTQDFDYVRHEGTLLVAFQDPSIAPDGTIAFGGIFGYVPPPPPDSTADVTPVAPDPLPPGQRSAILTCRDGHVKVIAEQGDRKPVPEDFEPVASLTTLKQDGSSDSRCSDGNEYDFRFGYLDQPSNANGHVVFRDSSEYPTGIFLSEPYCGD